MTDSGKLDVLFATPPAMGHITPLLPFAEELRRRGHSVTFVLPSQAKYKRKLESCGLSDCGTIVYRGDKDGPGFLAKSDENGKNMYDTVMEHYSSEQAPPTPRPSVVVYDFFAFDAADAADKLGVPAVAVFPNLAVSINPWPASARTQERSWAWALWCKALVPFLEGVLARLLWLYRAQTRRSRGLPLLQEQDVYPTPFQRRPMIGSTTPELEWHADRLQESGLFAMVGPAITAKVEAVSEDLDSWLQEQQKHDRVVVYVAFGTVFRYSRKFVQTLQSQLAEFGTRIAVLWSLPEDAQRDFLNTETLPGHWRVQRFLPQVGLLRTGRVGAFVTHCGSGSVLEALLSGVPMVCCPWLADRAANALRLSRLGVGVVSHNGVAGVGAALEEALGNLDDMRRAAAQLAKVVQSHGGAGKGASVIEQIARGKNSGVLPLTRAEAPMMRMRMPWWPVPLLILGAIPVVVWGVRSPRSLKNF